MPKTTAKPGPRKNDEPIAKVAKTASSTAINSPPKTPSTLSKPQPGSSGDGNEGTNSGNKVQLKGPFRHLSTLPPEIVGKSIFQYLNVGDICCLLTAATEKTDHQRLQNAVPFSQPKGFDLSAYVQRVQGLNYESDEAASLVWKAAAQAKETICRDTLSKWEEKPESLTLPACPFFTELLSTKFLNLQELHLTPIHQKYCYVYYDEDTVTSMAGEGGRMQLRSSPHYDSLEDAIPCLLAAVRSMSALRSLAIYSDHMRLQHLKKLNLLYEEFVTSDYCNELEALGDLKPIFCNLPQLSLLELHWCIRDLPNHMKGIQDLTAAFLASNPSGQLRLRFPWEKTVYFVEWDKPLAEKCRALEGIKEVGNEPESKIQFLLISTN